jgi:prolyl-tRNA editing enzyme YbaK/EbsC (Cys-tRNA(Pro) deacylase)
MPANTLSPSAQKVANALQELGILCQIVELPQSTRTAPDAAAAVGCSVGQIVKSLIFRGCSSRQAYLFLVSGSNRLDETMMAALLGEKIERADPAFVREQTGFAIGGVAPLGFPSPLKTLMDIDLFQYKDVWAAAGTPNAVFRIEPQHLLDACHAIRVKVC